MFMYSKEVVEVLWKISIDCERTNNNSTDRAKYGKFEAYDGERLISWIIGKNLSQERGMEISERGFNGNIRTKITHLICSYGTTI